MKCLELFGGAGIGGIGMARAGFSHCAIVEKDTTAAGAALLNHPSARVFDCCVSDAPVSLYLGVDMILASPPCQPYSKAGYRMGSGDPRDGWPLLIEAIRVVAPRWVVIENVIGAPFTAWQRALTSLGYAYSRFKVLNASSYGIPQHRKRGILIAGPVSICWPEPTHGPGAHLPYNTVRSTLGYPLYSFATHPEGASRIADRRIREIFDRPTQCLGVYRGVNWAGSLWATDGSDPRNPHTRRPLRIDELLTLQGAEGAYLAGTLSQKYRQIGNALPPVLLEIIGRSIMAADRAHHEKRRSAPPQQPGRIPGYVKG